MKTIRDTVHGYINLTETEVNLLDTPEMQRLRNINQLGFGYLVYPSATHTRFEHSLGTLFLAERAAKHLELEEERASRLRLAALLHDIGHGPFSHISENAIAMHVENKHEKRTQDIIKNSRISDTLKSAGFSPNKVAQTAIGERALGTVLAGDIDIDRMDYLMRDAYYTGNAFGVIDPERILQMARLYRKKFVLEEEGLSSAESLVIARYLMYPTVYEHHTVRIVAAMFSNSVLECIEDGVFTVEELYEMDDTQVISKMRGLDAQAGEIMDRIQRRDLYKRALVVDKNDLGDNFSKIRDIKSKRLQEIEIELTESAGLKAGEVLLDISQPLYEEDSDALILQKGKLLNLGDVSPLVRALREAQWSYWNVGVYCPKENVSRVERSARGILLGL